MAYAYQSMQVKSNGIQPHIVTGYMYYDREKRKTKEPLTLHLVEAKNLYVPLHCNVTVLRVSKVCLFSQKKRCHAGGVPSTVHSPL